MSSKSRKKREVVVDHQPEPGTAIPWPEWRDSELNSEKWDVPKNGTDGHFLDSEERAMPPSLEEPHDWIRGSKLRNLSSSPVVATPSSRYPDFVKNNKHILHSEFVRCFVSTMINLQYIGREGLQVEGTSPNFVWLGHSRPWQGWMYIYSMNKAGSAVASHRPVVNPNGKYVVRLYFMGFWRRFVVDDFLPVDKDGRPLLPRTENEFELWPMLLAKAMIKLAAISWTDRKEINDFYPVSCLTGWICLPLVTRTLSSLEKWNLLTKNTGAESEAEVPINVPNTTKPGEGTADGKKMKKQDPAVVTFANIINTMELEEETVPGITPCWSHTVYIDKSKDISVDTSQVRWKLYRWFDWASRHVTATEGNFLGPGVRSVKLVSSLRQCGEENPVADLVDEEAHVESTSKDTSTRDPFPDVVQPLPDIGVWVDFIKMAPCLDEIFIFYKPSDFEYCTRVSDLFKTTADNQVQVSAAGSRVKSQATGSKEGKKVHNASASSVRSPPPFQSSFKWQRKMSACSSDPLYMLVDSLDTKFVLIDFSSMPEPSAASTRSYLIVERHNFFETSADDDAAASVCTVSEGATIFEAGPGRHLFRVLFRPEYSYFVTILSDTVFQVGDRLRIQDLMSSESDRIEAIAKSVSNGISAALQEFGRPGYAGQLRAFYDSYMPREADRLRSNADKKTVKSIHWLFIEELISLIRETFPAIDAIAICRALRVFFVNPAIGFHPRYTGPNLQTEEEKFGKQFSIYETAAVRLQSFFRMRLVRIYQNLHDPSHPKHSQVVQSLRKVVELFNYSKRESAAQAIIRKIMDNEDVSSSLYPCHEDLSRVLKIEEWKGVVRNVQPGQWIPVFRVVLNPERAGETVHAGIDLVTSLPRHVIRVMNNQTYREITRIVNKVTTAHYPHVERGYTVIGYGWSDGSKFKELDWRVRVTTMKGQPAFRQTMISDSSLPGAKPPVLIVRELSNNYVPNVLNIIGKWTITVCTDSLLSFRLSTSYSEVETAIKIVDKEGDILHEANGGSVIILPAVCLPFLGKRDGQESFGDVLKTRSRSKSLVLDSAKDFDETNTRYYVQAFVRNDSWPLTPNEWIVANDVKTRGTVYDPRQGKTSVSSISKRGIRARVSARGSEDRFYGDGDATTDGASPKIFQDPLCRLEIVADAGTKVQVEHDRRREAEIAGMKRLWEDAEPGRLLRGRDLRDEFLKENSIVRAATSTNSEFMATGSSEESVREFSELKTPGDTELRTLKPPSNIWRVLPSLNVAAYAAKDEDDEEERWVKTEGDEEMLRNQRAINLLDFEQEQMAFAEEDVALMNEQRQRYYDTFNSYMKKVEEWNILDEVASEKRNAYVAEVKAAISVRGADKNAKDTIKKKRKREK